MSYIYEKKFDVVIVGAGVIGCSIAYHLARLSDGKMKVAVLERNSVGSETSSGSAGMLAAQIEVESQSPLLSLALESRRLFGPLAEVLKDQTGVDVGYRANGILETAYTPERAAALRARRDWQAGAGLDCRAGAAWLIGARAAYFQATKADYTMPWNRPGPNKFGLNAVQVQFNVGRQF